MFAKLPPATRALLIANAVVFLLQWFAGESMLGRVMEMLQLWPVSIGEHGYGAPSFMPCQLVTYGFMHGSIGHLFFNMLALVMFGAQVEHEWGAKRFATYYFTCIVGAISPISSRNTVPLSATSIRPFLFESAPVNAPRMWPNSSDSRSASGRAPQLTATNGCSRRSD